MNKENCSCLFGRPSNAERIYGLRVKAKHLPPCKTSCVGYDEGVQVRQRHTHLGGGSGGMLHGVKFLNQGCQNRYGS